MEPWWERPIRNLVAGRRVILAGGVAPVWGPVAPLIRRLGATDVLVVATEGRGVGPAPDEETVIVEPPTGLGLMEIVRFGVETLRRPPDHVQVAVDRFDPDGESVVIGNFLNEAADLFGRRFISHRRPEWVALEDKTVVDAVWDNAGVARAAAATVPVAEAHTAARRLDLGHGTVWAVDASQGWHGGAHLTRWVRTDQQALAVTDELARHGSTVRVMPFLEGVPCSIHGIVADDGVAVLRPVEMVTLRRPSDRTDLFYAGCSTYWDPAGPMRDQMRAAARAVGRHLSDRVGFRGGFTVDGVATAHGFRPTELNPRPGAGLGLMGRGLPDGLPLLLLIDLIAGGVDIGRSAEQLEHQLLANADASRSGGTWRFASDIGADLAGQRWWYADGVWHEPDGPEADLPSGVATATIMGGPRAVRATFDPDTWPAGPSVAPAAAALYRHLDAHRGTNFGALSAAVEVGSGGVRSGGRRPSSTRP